MRRGVRLTEHCEHAWRRSDSGEAHATRGGVEAAVTSNAALVPDLSVAEPRTRLGDLLVHSGVVTRDALEQGSQHANGQRLGTVLIDRGVISEEDVRAR